MFGIVQKCFEQFAEGVNDGQTKICTISDKIKTISNMRHKGLFYICSVDNVIVYFRQKQIQIKTLI